MWLFSSPFFYIYRCVKYVGLCVVAYVLLSIPVGQQTPGINKRLKHSESLKFPKSNNNDGQTLRSSQRPDRPLGVMQRFSPSLPSKSSIKAAMKCIFKKE